MKAGREAADQVELAGTAEQQKAQTPILSSICLVCTAPTDRLSAICWRCRRWIFRESMRPNVDADDEAMQ